MNDPDRPGGDELLTRARQAAEFLRAGHPDPDDMAVHDLFLAKILDGLVAEVAKFGAERDALMGGGIVEACRRRGRTLADAEADMEDLYEYGWEWRLGYADGFEATRAAAEAAMMRAAVLRMTEPEGEG